MNFASVRVITDDVDRLVDFFETVTDDVDAEYQRLQRASE